MANLFDSQLDELLAKGGTFDITGTDAVTDKQFWGFNASEGAVLEAIEGIKLKDPASTLAEITAAEEDISGVLLTAVDDPLLAGVIYRAAGYIITNVKLTSGTFHGFLMKTQITE